MHLDLSHHLPLLTDRGFTDMALLRTMRAHWEDEHLRGMLRELLTGTPEALEGRNGFSEVELWSLQCRGGRLSLDARVKELRGGSVECGNSDAFASWRGPDTKRGSSEHEPKSQPGANLVRNRLVLAQASHFSAPAIDVLVDSSGPPRPPLSFFFLPFTTKAQDSLVSLCRLYRINIIYTATSPLLPLTSSSTPVVLLVLRSPSFSFRSPRWLYCTIALLTLLPFQRLRDSQILAHHKDLPTSTLGEIDVQDVEWDEHRSDSIVLSSAVDATRASPIDTASPRVSSASRGKQGR
ncbi:hypothetical protein C8R46DRAFT_1027866 [Mycena filopes]|nr:hypothetical protein C8R46DRAFT_1027866 [Mycena filopes]